MTKNNEPDSPVQESPVDWLVDAASPTMVLLRDQNHQPLALMLRATREEDLELAHLLSGVRELRSALQWLLDDMTDAGEDANPETGDVYDSVQSAREILVKYGGYAHDNRDQQTAAPVDLG